MTDKVQIYTDGACLGNPGPGGWGVLLIKGSNQKELSGAEANTTNNRMELMAAIKGLQACSSMSVPSFDVEMKCSSMLPGKALAVENTPDLDAGCCTEVEGGTYRGQPRC